MDKVKQMMDGLSGGGEPSALSLVGMTGNTGPNLLQEALDGRIGAPAAHPSLPESETEPARNTGWGLRELKDQYKSGRQEIAADPEPEDDEPEQEDEITPSPKRELPTEWHSINEELQRVKEHNARLEQQQQEQNKYLEQRRNFEMQQYQRQQMAQPDPYEKLAEQFGFEDPSVVKALAGTIQQQMRQEMHAQYAPLMAQQQRDHFNSTVQQLRNELPEFDKYFNVDRLRETHENVMRQQGIQRAAGIDWKKEITQAHKSADYERIKKELDDRNIPSKKEERATKERKEEQKSKLALVPKASHQGAAAGAKSLRKDLDALPDNLSFKSFGRELSKRLGVVR